MYQINANLLNEVFRVCFKRKDFLEIVLAHLKYQFIPVEEYKRILQAMNGHYMAKGTVPSVGIIAQKFQASTDRDVAVIKALDAIQSIDFPNISDTMSELEVYIKDAMSLDDFGKFVDLFNEGKTDEARSLVLRSGESLAKFSLTNPIIQSKGVFTGFGSRQSARIIKHHAELDYMDKVPFSIDEIDAATGGGIDVTDTFCLLARSGTGKTKFLRHVGVGAARRRRKVLHIQAEGSEDSCLRGYDATWTGVLMSDIRGGSIPDDKYNDLLKISRKIRAQGGEVYVHAFEQFNSASMADVRHLAYDIMKSVGDIDLILIDYLELLDPANGKMYKTSEERHRRLAVANDMKNLAVELGTRVGTATQANDVAPRLLDDPEFVMTRHNVSEVKAIVNPFSYFFTANQTPEEYDDGIMRLHADKFRDFKGNKTFTIYQDYDHDRFYDRKRTISSIDVDSEIEPNTDFDSEAS